MLTPEAANRIGVTYAVVERGSLAAEMRTVGLVTYDETRVKTIAPKVDGYVEQLFVAFTGQPVEVNDSLLRIYSPMLVTAQEELLLAKKLAADVSSGSPDAVRNAESLLSAARRRLKYWDIPDEDVARVERTGEVQKTLTLRSPLRGVVVQKNVSAGQRIMAGDAVYQVADLREVWLEGEVFERDLAAIRLGETVTAEFAAMPGQPRQGRIVYVSPTISAETRTTKIRVALPNADLALKPGMYATIHIRGEARRNVLSVPRSAVLSTGRAEHRLREGRRRDAHAARGRAGREHGRPRGNPPRTRGGRDGRGVGHVPDRRRVEPRRRARRHGEHARAWSDDAARRNRAAPKAKE